MTDAVLPPTSPNETYFRLTKANSQPIPLPDWLSAVPDSIEPPPINPYLLAERNHLIYSGMFELVLARVSAGESMAKVMRSFNRVEEKAEYIRWIMKDPERKSKYYEAKAIAAEVLDDERIEIADGVDSNGNPVLEDIARSKLRIETREKSMATRDRKRFGDTKSIEINQTISITDALKEAQSRLAHVIDAEIIESSTKPLQIENDTDA